MGVDQVKRSALVLFAALAWSEGYQVIPVDTGTTANIKGAHIHTEWLREQLFKAEKEEQDLKDHWMIEHKKPLGSGEFSDDYRFFVVGSGLILSDDSHAATPWMTVGHNGTITIEVHCDPLSPEFCTYEHAGGYVPCSELKPPTWRIEP